jgi:hypothetical protein
MVKMTHLGSRDCSPVGVAQIRDVVNIYCTKPLPPVPTVWIGRNLYQGRWGVSMNALLGEELAYLLSASQSVFHTGEALEDH